jgi:TatD DNase family protein
VIDTHVNLHHPAFADDLDDVLARAHEAGVSAMISICDTLDHFPAVKAASERAGAWRTIGVHPHYAKDYPQLSADTLIAAATEDARIVAIGETGLDLYYGHSPIEDQERSFRAHIAAARATGLPLIVHTREADALTAAILEEETGRGPFAILLHCYTSGPDLHARGLALGAYVSFSGIATFKNAHDVRAMLDATPLDRLLIETDCPYLAPIPHRGARNEPAFLPALAAFIAERAGMSREALVAQTDANTRRLFTRMAE